jgi:magnesium transporter
MDVYSYLYDARGNDEEIELEKIDYAKIRRDQLLWVNILKRDEAVIRQVTGHLGIKNVPIKSIMKLTQRPTLERYDDFYRFFIDSVEMTNGGRLKRVQIDYLVGRNFLITIHDGKVEYFQEFRDREKGETQIGDLDAESFLATLLDLHLVTYFRALEKIEDAVDRLDLTILRKNLQDEEFLRETVRLKSDVAKLRRWLLPHRDVFYAISRPDFTPVAESDSVREFQTLGQHFENAVDAVESARDTVLSLFDLYTTRAAHRMNGFIKRLTFVTLLVGLLGAIAGIWGMNFEVEYFKTAEQGFWLTIGAMGLLTLLLTVVAKLLKWI